MDENKLRAWLDANVKREGEAFSVERHQAGHSNETFFVEWGASQLVLRRPPKGAFLPTAHDVLREHRILEGLKGSKVRAPATVAACEDEGVLGAPFYLMERVVGQVVRDNSPTNERVADEMVDALVEVHAAPWRGTSLERIGKAEGYLERQVRRWTGQMEMTLPWTENARPVPELPEVGKWLAANIPDSPPTTLVHGDYKIDNVLWRDDSLVSILDWEMSTLGDPLADLGWMLAFWDDYKERGGARYQRATGLDAGNLRYYETLAVWKLAILLEGSYARHLLGATDDPFFEQMRTMVPDLAKRALRTATH